MELLGKLTDAASMFWQALDERERMIVVYAGAWLAVVALSTLHTRGRERLKQELREELATDGTGR